MKTNATGLLFGRIWVCAAGSLLALVGSFSARASDTVLEFTGVTGTTGSYVHDEFMVLDSPKINGKPTLKLVVTQNWALDDVYNDRPVGVIYDKSLKKWEVFNEDDSDMVAGSGFNVLISVDTFRVNAGPANSEYDWTFFPEEKKKPAALFLATHVANPAQDLTDPLFSDHNLGVFYDGPVAPPAPLDENVWAVYNDDVTPPLPVAYNITDVTKDPHAFVFLTTTNNIGGDSAVIDNPVSNGNPNAVVFVTHIYNSPGGPNNYFDIPVGVWYDGDHWLIFTEDETTMPAGATFVVDIYAKPTP